MSLYCLALDITCSSSTFRVSPPATKEIRSYSFIPPTVLSGYMKRILDSIGKTSHPPLQYFLGFEYTKNELKELEKRGVFPLKINYRFSLYDSFPSVACCGAYWFSENRIRLKPVESKHRFGIRVSPTGKDRSSYLIVGLEKRKEKWKLSGGGLAGIEDLFIHVWEYVKPITFRGFLVGMEKAINTIHKMISCVEIEKRLYTPHYWWRIGKKGIGIIDEVFKPVKLLESVNEHVPTSVVPVDEIESFPREATFIEVLTPRRQYKIYEFVKNPNIYGRDSFAITSNPIRLKNGFLVGDMEENGFEIAIPSKLVKLFGVWS
jgi:hypothetical protein